MSNISFSIQNPDSTPANQPDIYLGKSNRLNFLFGNSLGIPKVNPGDVFSINIPDNLITSASADQLVGDKWKVKQVTQISGYYSYNLTPAEQLPFKGTITISLHNLKGLTATNGEVLCSLVIGKGTINGPSTKLFVNQPPSHGLDSLQKYITPTPPFINEDQEEIARGTVYTSPVVKESGEIALNPPVANQIHLNLKFSGSQLVDKPWDGTPKFMFSFSYGSEDIDLTNALKASDNNYSALTSAWMIGAQIGQGQSDRWNLLPLDSNADSPVWVVEAIEANPHLFTNNHPNLDIIFDHVITDLAAGSASVYIQWANIPGYNPGRFVLDIQKQDPVPKLLNFTKSGSGFSPQQPVELDWETFAAADLDLFWSQNRNRSFLGRKRLTVYSKESSEKLTVQAYRPGSSTSLIYTNSNALIYNDRTVGYAIPPFNAQPISYSCILQVPGKQDTQHSLTLNLAAATPPVISTFTITEETVNSERKLMASWLVKTDNVNAYCLLSGIDEALPTAAEGGGVFSYEIPLAKGQVAASSYTLTVMGFEPAVSKTINRSYQNAQTLKGLQIENLSPSGASAYASKTMDQIILYFFNTANIPATIYRALKVGKLTEGGTIILMGEGVKYAYASNGLYPTPNKQLFYFDPDNPPTVPQKFVEIDGLLFPMAISPDKKKLFVWEVIKAGFAYFDPNNPPASVKMQMKLGGDPGPGLGQLIITEGCNTAYFIFLSISSNKDQDNDDDDLPVYYFDWTNPPAVVDTFFNMAIGYADMVISPDGKTMFIGIDDKLYYFPADDPPADLTKSSFLSVGSNIDKMLIAPEGQMFVLTYSVDNQLQYFDWRAIPKKITKSVKLPLQYADINALALSSDGQLIFMVDDTNKKFYFASSIDPSQAISAADTGPNPFQIDVLPNGERVFVSNSDNTVSVIDLTYQ